MSNKNLFQEAIADAKAVREAALANAKAVLEESLTPRIQSMIAMKLEEMEEMDEESYGIDTDAMEDMEEGMYPDDTSDEIQDRYRATGAALEEEDLDEELDLSAILAELEAEETLAEAKKDDDESDDEESDDEESKEDVKIEDMTVDELTDLIKDIVAQEIGDAEEAPADDMGDEMDMDAGEEISVEDTIDEEINLDELLAELDALDEEEDMEKESMYERKAKDAKKVKKAEEEMNEAIATIQTLRNELNEVNLLNAKLLYVNKIFKSKNLTESQKVHVIASFDKATNVREAKVVFESLNTALTTAVAKKPIKESLGFASKAAGIAPSKQPIVESNDAIARMQKLANIIK